MKNYDSGRKKSLSLKMEDLVKPIILIACCWLLFSGALIAGVRDAGKIYKIGVSEWTGYPDSVKGFKDSMTKGGFIEGQNVIYLDQSSGINATRQREIAQSFREAGVDLVYSLTTPGTLIMKQFMPETTPIVFSIVTYPADSGLIESFDYSGNNLVGTSNYVELTNYIRLLKLSASTDTNTCDFPEEQRAEFEDPCGQHNSFSEKGRY